MTEIILSPGVYTQELDQSFIPPGQTQTGLAIVGPTEKGAAYVPTDVTSYADFVAKFGTDTSETYVPQTVFSYLQAGISAKVTRVLGNGGFVFNTSNKVAAIVNGSKIVTVLFPSKNKEAASANLNECTITGTYNNFDFLISGSQLDTKPITASFDPTASNYLLKLIGTNEYHATSSIFPYLHFGAFFTGSTDSAVDALVFNDSAITYTSSYSEGYDAAATPWVLSDAGVRLFRFVHKSHGFATNRDVKVSIANIRQNSDASIYSTFDVLVRKYSDTDRTQSILEQFNGVSLNPDAPNYIARVIGDKYKDYNQTLERIIEHGDYNSASNYIRVEVFDAVSAGSVVPNAIPNGFEPLVEPVAGFTGYTLPSASYIASNTASIVYSGFDYSNSDNINYLNPVPAEAGTGSNASFTKPTNDNKFTIPFQGGSDGTNFAVIKKIGSAIKTDGTNVFGFDLSTSSTGGTIAYQKAINILSNPEEFSFDLLALPGVIEQYHNAVTGIAQAMVEQRADSVYIRDLTGVNDTVATAVNLTAGVDSSYSATYFPWVQVNDIGSNKVIYVPPSVVVLDKERSGCYYGFLAAVIWLIGVIVLWLVGGLVK